MLRRALPEHCYRHAVTVESVEPNAGSVRAQSGATVFVETADLVVVADGIRSCLREQLEPRDQPVYAGYVAWRGLVDESSLSAATHAALFGKFGFCLPDGEQMLGYPVAGEGDRVGPGQRRYNFVWYRLPMPGLVCRICLPTLWELCTTITLRHI